MQKLRTIKINRTMKWKVIEGYNGMYEVSDEGMVRSRNRAITNSAGISRYVSGRTLKFKVNKDGYRFVSLSFCGKVTSHYLHRLVAEAFIPNSLSKPMVNHLNGRKADNSIHNLEWATPSENLQHAYDAGLCSTIGATHHKARAVIDTTTGLEYPTIKSAAEALGYSYHTLRNMLSGYNQNRTTLVYR